MQPPGALQDPFELTGTVLEGQYRADDVVGEGGFGVVYRGRHLSLDQPIAIKVLKGLDGGDPTINALVLEKFRAEARLLYTLSQSSLHIVRCLDFGATTMPSGAWAPFMILEWLDGTSLADDLLERRSQGKRGRSVQETLAILEPVADGLAVAHQQQVAHRDVKPANIFLLRGGRPGQKGQVKVLDFGIAKIMKEGESAGTKGTFASFTWLYASPEQLDPRLGLTGLATDVYGFGLLLTELLTDRKPIDDKNVVDIMKTASNPNRRPTPRTRGANVPDDVEAVCRRALAVNPRDRFASISEMWSALAATATRDGRGPMTTTPQQQVQQVQMQGAAPPPPSIAITPPGSAVPSTATSGPSVPANPMAATGLAPPSAMPGSMVAVSMPQSSVGAPPSPRVSHSSPRQVTALPMSAVPMSYAAQHGHLPSQNPNTPPNPVMMSPPMGTRPPGFLGPPANPVITPQQQPQFGGPMVPVAPQQPPSPPQMHAYPPNSPPFGTAPPGHPPPPVMMRRLPFVRSDGTSPIVYVTIIFFVLTVLLAGTCAAVHAAC